MQFKGINDGILVRFHSKNWENQHEELIREIESREEFFRGAKLNLDLGSLDIHSAALGKLRDELSSSGLSLCSIISTSQITRESAMLLGIEQGASLSSLKSFDLRTKQTPAGVTSSYLEKDVLKGEIIESKYHVIIIGDVHAGAEIISAGNIIVWGKILGAVLGGSQGDESAFVCALELAPTFIQIAHIFSTPTRRNAIHKPEISYLQNGKIITIDWKRSRMIDPHHDSK
jgi:septum site-determining protein MinC